jgi:hypothetical protein
VIKQPLKRKMNSDLAAAFAAFDCLSKKKSCKQGANVM